MSRYRPRYRVVSFGVIRDRNADVFLLNEGWPKGEVPTSQVRWTRGLSASGVIEVDVPADRWQPGVSCAALGWPQGGTTDPIAPLESVLYVEREGSVVTGGPVLRRQRVDAGTIRVSAVDWWSYYRGRVIPATVEFGESQNVTVAQAVTALFDAVHRSSRDPRFNPAGLYLSLGDLSSLGPVVDRYDHQEFVNMGGEVERLAAAYGFDFRVSTAWTTDAGGGIGGEPGWPVNTFEASTTLGRPDSTAQLAFTLGGNVTGVDYTEDASGAVTWAHVNAENDRAAVPVEVLRSDMRAAGLFVVDGVQAHRTSDTNDRQRAGEQMTQRTAAGMTVPRVTVDVTQWPWMEFDVGDEAKVNIDDVFPRAYSSVLRISGIDVTWDGIHETASIEFTEPRYDGSLS